LFGGNSTTEPITLAAKFSTISADVQSELNELNQTKIQPELFLQNKTKSISDVFEKTISNKSSTSTTPSEITTDVTSKDSSIITGQDEITDETSFPIELVIGIGIGFAIGLVFVFITKRNSDK